MAKCGFNMPDDFLKEISKLDKNIDKVTEKMLKAGGQVVLKETKKDFVDVVGKNTKYGSRSTGEMAKALGVSHVDVDKNGVSNVKVGFDEPRKNQYDAKGKRTYYEITNAMIANVIENGKHGQPAKPFLRIAKRRSKKPCIEAMQKVFDEEIKGL